MSVRKVEGVALEQRGVGEPLLLLHGTGGSRAHWIPLTDRLAEHHQLLLVDLPGHGESDPPPAQIPHTPIGYAGLLTRLLDALGIEAVHAAGNSVGGWTALELAKLGRARSVVAIAPAGMWAKHDPWRCTFQLSSQYRMGRLFAPLVPSLLGSAVGRTILMSGTMAKPWQMPAEAAIEMATTYARTPTFKTHLAQTRRERFRRGQHIAVPVTVAWGEKERLIPKKARLRRELPAHTRYITLRGCGHTPMWDDRDLIAQTIMDGATSSQQTTEAAPETFQN